MVARLLFLQLHEATSRSLFLSPVRGDSVTSWDLYKTSCMLSFNIKLARYFSENLQPPSCLMLSLIAHITDIFMETSCDMQPATTFHSSAEGLHTRAKYLIGSCSDMENKIVLCYWFSSELGISTYQGISLCDHLFNVAAFIRPSCKKRRGVKWSFLRQFTRTSYFFPENI